MNKMDLIQPLQDFLKGSRQVSLPFDLTIDGKIFHCEAVLRLLPAKRLVLKAQLDNQTCVLKLFVKKQKGQREFVRERQGHQWAKQAGLNVPALLFASEAPADVCAIAYEYIAESTSLQLTQSEQMLRYLANMHQQGIYQEDIHLDNLLVKHHQIVLIDLASVKCPHPDQPLTEETSLTNLALFIAQFDLVEQQTLLSQLSVYFQQRQWLFELAQQQQFSARLKSVWQKRLQTYLSKCFRDCTMTAYQKTSVMEYAIKRNYLSVFGDITVAKLDELMTKGTLLKAGNSATVALVQLEQEQLVIKRYNLKSWRHWLKRFWRRSRAANAWEYGNLLALAGIPTPKVIGYIEKRHGPFRAQAYLITRYSPGVELSTRFAEQPPNEDVMRQIQQIFELMQHLHVTHGDMKASNFLVDYNDNVSLIDLDSMQRHQSQPRFQRLFQQDLRRFNRNWSG